MCIRISLTLQYINRQVIYSRYLIYSQIFVKTARVSISNHHQLCNNVQEQFIWEVALPNDS